ncbi:amino acid-binding protein [Haloarchaeobius sp. HME9146]|uniref:amino acid-binding protein n=1 Tax=Haloarchaeobius sp. HME9146 TaxID=2978732 RepID=UPI0021C161F6|nr:amino acid-binding protein [Haloarchaeobius sp. HME9146]MCT9095347.1 amino acid-binding protein [Haloarchaeobius sp. HME9146]
MATDVSETRRAYTVRLELVDEPGELLRALRPIADNGGNLLSIFHERGNLTPRGNIPVEVDLECTPSRFDDVVNGLRDAGVTIIQAGADQYAEQVSVLLVGHLVETDLSDTLETIEECSGASVTDFALDAPAGTDDVSSARAQLAIEPGQTEEALSVVRTVAERKDLRVVEPLVEGEA